MPHIPGHISNGAPWAGLFGTPAQGPARPRSNPFAGFENLRQRMQGLTPSVIPPSRPIRGYRPPRIWPNISPPVPMPEWPPKGFRPPQIPPAVPMPEYLPPGRGPLNPLPLPVPMPGPGWPGPGGFLPPQIPLPPSRHPFGGSDLLYRWPAPGTPPIRPETLPYYPSAPPPRRVLF